MTRRQQQRGFTLIELLVVLVVLALVYAIAAPSVFTAGERRQLSRATATVYHSLRQARGQAIMTGEVVQRDTAMFKHDGVALTQTAPPGPPGPIMFYPDGSATQTQLDLAIGSQRNTITVDWLTGHVALGE